MVAGYSLASLACLAIVLLAVVGIVCVKVLFALL
jgi:hypothetical protein